MPQRGAPTLLFKRFRETALDLTMLYAFATIDFLGTAAHFVEQVDLILSVFELASSGRSSSNLRTSSSAVFIRAILLPRV